MCCRRRLRRGAKVVPPTSREPPPTSQRSRPRSRRCCRRWSGTPRQPRVQGQRAHRIVSKGLLFTTQWSPLRPVSTRYSRAPGRRRGEGEKKAGPRSRRALSRPRRESSPLVAPPVALSCRRGADFIIKRDGRRKLPARGRGRARRVVVAGWPRLAYLALLRRALHPLFGPRGGGGVANKRGPSS